MAIVANLTPSDLITNTLILADVNNLAHLTGERREIDGKFAVSLTDELVSALIISLANEAARASPRVASALSLEEKVSSSRSSTISLLRRFREAIMRGARSYDGRPNLALDALYSLLNPHIDDSITAQGATMLDLADRRWTIFEKEIAPLAECFF